MKNSDYSIKNMQEVLMKELEAKRYEHSLGVAYTAAALAMCYQYNVEKAFVAGLLHDCAKCMKKQAKESYCKKMNIEFTEAELKIPALQHAKIGSYLCETKYNVQDSDIKTAIRYHTTGKADMTILEKIIYISDYIEPNRMPLPRIELVRKESFHNLDYAMELILEDCLNHLIENGGAIDPMTHITYEFYHKHV